jgi:hypothetical protein
MLGEHPVDVMLLATDLGVARGFYGDTLGLQVLLEDEQFLTFRCGGDSRLVVTKSSSGTREQATKASWRMLPARSPSCGRGASRFRISPSWAPSTVWPISASRWRPGSSTRITTESASSSSRIPPGAPAAPQPAPGRPMLRCELTPRTATHGMESGWRQAQDGWNRDQVPDGGLQRRRPRHRDHPAGHRDPPSDTANATQSAVRAVPEWRPGSARGTPADPTVLRACPFPPPLWLG